jgi:hypothetical protein
VDHQVATRGLYGVFPATPVQGLKWPRPSRPPGANSPPPWTESAARADLDEARRLIESCAYHRRDPELADAEAALGVIASP